MVKQRASGAAAGLAATPGDPPPRQFPNAPHRAGWLSAGSFVAAAAVMGAVSDRPPGIDRGWERLVVRRRSPGLDHAASFLNQAGRGVGRAATLAAIGMILARRRRPGCLAAFALTEAATPAAVNVIKLVIRRRRPAGAAVRARGSAFPSGHVAYAAATTASVVLVCDQMRPVERRVAWLGCVLATAAMGWSRTYLRLHWATDALAGGLVGYGTALASFEYVAKTHGVAIVTAARP
jgi:PAP2 superfamily